jgi:hypothetical protein
MRRIMAIFLGSAVCLTLGLTAVGTATVSADGPHPAVDCCRQGA